MQVAVKVAAVLTWVLILASPFGVIPAPWDVALISLGGGLLVVHTVELVVFHRAISARPEPRPVQIVMTLLFGLFYWKAPVPEAPRG